MQIGVRPRNRKQPPWHGPLLGRAHADGLGGLARAAARGVAGQEAAPLAAWVDGIHRTRRAVDTARQVDAARLGLRPASGAAGVPRRIPLPRPISSTPLHPTCPTQPHPAPPHCTSLDHIHTTPPHSPHTLSTPHHFSPPRGSGRLRKAGAGPGQNKTYRWTCSRRSSMASRTTLIRWRNMWLRLKAFPSHGLSSRATDPCVSLQRGGGIIVMSGLDKAMVLVS